MDIALKQFQVACNGEVFWHKLCAENNWSRAHADKVFVEYKRFLWLAKVSRQRIVPSNDVDTVWHLHMTFTKSYWLDLCDVVLGFKLHHVPSALDRQSEHQDTRDYQHTLAMYENEFGCSAPLQIWPQIGKVRKRAFYSLRNKKPVSIRQRIERITCCIVFGGLVLSGCSIDTDHDLFTYVKWTIAVYIIYRFLKWLSSHSGGGRGGSGCGSSCGGSCGGGD